MHGLLPDKRRWRSADGPYTNATSRNLLCAVSHRIRLYAGFVEYLRLRLREIVNERAIFYGAIILAARRDWRRKCLNGLDIEGGMFFHKRQAAPLYCRTGSLPLKTEQIVKMLPVCPI